jgi:hypothetical protein
MYIIKNKSAPLLFEFEGEEKEKTHPPKSPLAQNHEHRQMTHRGTICLETVLQKEGLETKNVHSRNKYLVREKSEAEVSKEKKEGLCMQENINNQTDIIF